MSHETRRTSHITRHTLSFSQVAEADQTLAALDAMWQENSPELPKPCIVIVHTSKRSAIRLFAKKGSNIFDNVVAGTIIDDGITSDSIFDFELVANNTKRVPLCRSCVHCNPHAKPAAKLARACRRVCLRTTRCCAFAATSKRAFSTPISLKVRVPPFEDPVAFACTTRQHHAHRCLRQGLDHQAHVRPLPPLLLLHPRIMRTPQCAHVGQPVSAHAQSCVHRVCHARCMFTVLCSCAEKCGLAETEPDATTHNTLYYS